MRSNRLFRVALALAASLTALTPALARFTTESTAAPPASATPASAAAHSAPLRVAVIGASASAGFGCSWRETRDDGDYSGSFRLADMLKLACPDLKIVTTDASSGFFFLAPVANGAKAAKRARDFKPDCIVALDFLFWYCYGDDGPEGGALRAESDRLVKLEKGLAELATFDVPVVVGDIPDMSRAVGKMLSARQMPSPDTLAKANERFLAWAKERTNVRVVPLAHMQRQLMEEGALEIGADRLVATKNAPLLQRDELHPTPQGLAGLACAVAIEVKSAAAPTSATEASVGQPDDCEPDPEQTIGRAKESLTRRPRPEPRTPAKDSAAPITPPQSPR
ncbi:MAG: hypothetical protein ACKO3W_08155 [bacterium]